MPDPKLRQPTLFDVKNPPKSQLVMVVGDSPEFDKGYQYKIELKKDIAKKLEIDEKDIVYDDEISDWDYYSKYDDV